MSHLSRVDLPDGVPGLRFSPLVLADRLLDLAREADRAGYAASADRLVRLAFAACDEAPAGRG